MGTGAKQESLDQAEIVTDDVHEVALVQVLAATDPGAAHATTIEHQGVVAGTGGQNRHVAGPVLGQAKHAGRAGGDAIDRFCPGVDLLDVDAG